MRPQAEMSRTERKRTTGIYNALMHRRSDNNAHPQRDCANQDRQSDVFILDDFAPQVIWRHLVEKGETENKNHDAEDRVDRGVQQIARMKISHNHFPPT